MRRRDVLRLVVASVVSPGLLCSAQTPKGMTIYCGEISTDGKPMVNGREVIWDAIDDEWLPAIGCGFIVKQTYPDGISEEFWAKVVKHEPIRS